MHYDAHAKQRMVVSPMEDCVLEIRLRHKEERSCTRKHLFLAVINAFTFRGSPKSMSHVHVYMHMCNNRRLTARMSLSGCSNL